MFKSLLWCVIEDWIRNVSGPLGIRLRRGWYRRRFKRCGFGLVVEPGVFIVNPAYIEVGENVWIDRQVTLIAGPARADARIEVRGCQKSVSSGEIHIGDNCHLGIGTIIQGHGGVRIGSAFTSSPHVKIYSFSNDYRRCRNGTVSSDAAYILTPVQIGRNVWLGINAIVIGHQIGDHVFVKPNAVVVTNIPGEAIVAGDPASLIGSRYEATSGRLSESV